MSTTELRRAGVLARVAAETLTLKSAAVLMEVSYRQAKRLYGRYRAEGAKGLKHRSAGRASNRAAAAAPAETGPGADPGEVQRRRGRAIRADAGGRALASEDGVTVDHETLRRWMLAAGLWSRARKRSPHRRRRERMAHFGELVQLDGSFHPWFEDRGPQSCLLTLVDDATGRSLGRFGAQETIWAAVGDPADVDRAVWDSAGALHGLEERVCAAAESGRAGDRRRTPDAIRPHVRDAGHQDHPGELAASQGAHRAQSRDASGSPGEEAAADRHRRCRGGECVSRRGVLGRPQSAIRAGAGVGRRLPRGASRGACSWTRSSASRRNARSRTTGWCATTIGCCRSSGKASGRRRAAPCTSSRTSRVSSRFAIAIA